VRRGWALPGSNLEVAYVAWRVRPTGGAWPDRPCLDLPVDRRVLAKAHEPQLVDDGVGGSQVGDD
jgi:hypothetical protein